MNIKMEVKIKMKLNGHRSSQTRNLLISILKRSLRPLSVPEIIESMKEQSHTFNKTTIYREIEKLITHEIVREVYLGSDKARYEMRDNRHHHHIMCTSCKKVDEVPVEDQMTEQEVHIAKKLNYTNINHSLEFFGVCKNCI
jgi:Fur family ferric uptake transcriptional regulator